MFHHYTRSGKYKEELDEKDLEEVDLCKDSSLTLYDSAARFLQYLSPAHGREVFSTSSTSTRLEGPVQDHGPLLTFSMVEFRAATTSDPRTNSSA